MQPIDITNVTPFLLSLLASGVGVILLAQIIKKSFGMDSDKAIHVMVLLVSGVATIASYVLQYKNLPVSILGVSSPAIYGFSQAVYKTAKALSDVLPKVSIALHQPAKPANISALNLDVPDDLVDTNSTPAAAIATQNDSSEFNL
jgi:hypothetical protein